MAIITTPHPELAEYSRDTPFDLRAVGARGQIFGARRQCAMRRGWKTIGGEEAMPESAPIESVKPDTQDIDLGWGDEESRVSRIFGHSAPTLRKRAPQLGPVPARTTPVPLVVVTAPERTATLGKPAPRPPRPHGQRAAAPVRAPAVEPAGADEVTLIRLRPIASEASPRPARPQPHAALTRDRPALHPVLIGVCSGTIVFFTLVLPLVAWQLLR